MIARMLRAGLRAVRRAWHPLATVALLALAGCTAAREADAFRPLAVGEPVPAFAVPTLAGDTARVGEGRQPLTLVNVWATWCGPCREEFPELAALHAAYASRGLRVLAVSIDEDGAAQVRPFITERDVRFAVGLDPADAIRTRYFALGVPESWLVSADGCLLWRQVGAIPKGGAAARAAIERALGTAPMATGAAR